MAAAARGEPGGVPSLVLAHFLRQLRTGFGATECTFPPDTPKPPMHITPRAVHPGGPEQEPLWVPFWRQTRARKWPSAHARAAVTQSGPRAALMAAATPHAAATTTNGERLFSPAPRHPQNCTFQICKTHKQRGTYRLRTSSGRDTAREAGVGTRAGAVRAGIAVGSGRRRRRTATGRRRRM